MEYFMRRIIQLSVATLAVSVVTGCSDRKEVTDIGYFPVGGVRFINAVNDTGGTNGVDFRFLDIVENNAHYAIKFRNNIVTSGGIPASTQIEYKATGAGDRHFTIFLDDPTPAVASTVLKDSTFKVEDQHNYTLLLSGRAQAGNTPAMALKVIDETTDGCADPGTQIALRFINATGSALDVRAYLNTQVVTKVGSAAATTTNTFTIPATPTFANVPPQGVSQCVNMPVTAYPTTVVTGNTTVTTTQTIKYNVKLAGTATNYVSTDGSALIGVPNGVTAAGCFVGVDCDQTPGTTTAGASLTGVVFPASIAGTTAAQFSSPAITFMWDRRPPRNAGT
jgi:hypothetical protein